MTSAKPTRAKLSVGWPVAALSLVFFACGGDQVQPDPSPQPTAAPTLDAPDPEPPSDDGADAKADAGAGGGAAETADKPKPRPKSSGRPKILMGPSKAIASTFGATPGSVLKLKGKTGTITWSIPEFALDAGYNIDFKIVDGAKAKKKGRPAGSVARVEMILGGKQKPKVVNAVEGKFELRWPIGKSDTINLAIGTAKTDSGGNETRDITWKIIAPTNVDTGFKEAYFHMTAIGPIQYFHGTSAAPEG